ncbi:MAG: EAL domain-containing protein [Candidatus Cloacimonetes bacterium]|nr:EAL domain-containing protein [Candidatus Cloacimonadota bacterium]
MSASQITQDAIDEVTGLNVLGSQSMKQALEIFETQRSLGVIYLDVFNLVKIENDYGAAVYDSIQRDVTKTIQALQGKYLRKSDLVLKCHQFDDAFLIILSKKRNIGGHRKNDLETIARRIHAHISSGIFFTTYKWLKRKPKLRIGYSFIVRNSLLNPQRMIYRAIEEARLMSTFHVYHTEIRYKETLQQIILDEDIKTVYQPMIDSVTGEIFSYEALSRGPEGTEFFNPLFLFEIAKESELLFELDNVCRKRAVDNAVALNPNLKLFINALPTTIHEPSFREQYLKEFLKKYGLKPENLVFEITESLAIQNYDSFIKDIHSYTDDGYQIALDDTGTGYSSFETILKIKPHYIKIDISMVRNVDTDPLKQTMIQALLNIAKSINARSIAEGIETVSEFKKLKELGVNYCQGYLFAKPGPPFPDVKRF